MTNFTLQRDESAEDELWILEHSPVFTLGQAGKSEHILNPHNIPVVNTDRGGQVTYHGPGQIIAYVLCDIKRNKLDIRRFVCLLEQAIIATLKHYNVNAYGKRDMPGVYINEEKIASIGLRIKRGCSYHGISFNIDMDLMPFQFINPCGYQGLNMTQLKHFVPDVNIQTVKQQLAAHLVLSLGASE